MRRPTALYRTGQRRLLSSVAGALLLGVAASTPAAERSPVCDPPLRYETDVLVLGGGPSGVAAAVAAARNGAGVLLVEQYGYLGGMGTAGGVNVFMSYTYIGGVFREVMRRLADCGGRRGPEFHPEMMKVVLDGIVTGAGVKLLLHTKGIGVRTAPAAAPSASVKRSGWRRVTGVVLDNKSGPQLARAKIYIDATGDGDLAAYAGAECQIGRPEDGLTQPMTMMFRLGGCRWRGGSLEGIPALEGIHMSLYPMPSPGEVLANMTRISGLSGVSGEDLTRAELEGRQQVMQCLKLLRENVRGFENAYLVSMPTQVGVRETRRVMGAKVVDEEDVVSGRDFSDAIARSSYAIDIHNPAGRGAQIVPVQGPYTIPYRTMIPRGLTNVFMTGRAISATHEAMSAIRIQPTCYALGEAAGTAASLGVHHRAGPWDMAPYLRELQTTLIKQGADLGPTVARKLGLYDTWQANRARYEREARVTAPAFTDVSPGSPLYEAVETVRQYGIASGVGENRYGVAVPAQRAIALAILIRAFEAAQGPVEPAEPPPLPDAPKGQWFERELRVALAKQIVLANELGDFRPNEPCTQRQLLLWALRAAQAAGVSGVPRPGAPDDQLIAAAVGKGMALPTGEYGVSFEAPATRGHAALAAAAIIRLMASQP